MRRLCLFSLACVTGVWAYRRLQRHPRTAAHVAEFERQGHRIVDQASEVLRSARDESAGVGPRVELLIG